MRVIVLFLFCLAASAALADPIDLSVDYAYISGDFTPAQAEQLDFKPYPPGMRPQPGQYPKGTVFRIQIPALDFYNKDFNLLVKPHYLTRATAWFHYLGQDAWVAVVRGRMIPPQPAYYSTLSLVFELEKPLLADHPVYLFVQDRGSPKPVSVSVEERSAYLHKDINFSRFIAALYGVIVVLAAINLVFYFFIRETPFLLYSLYMLTALASLQWQEGWISRIFDINNPQQSLFYAWLLSTVSILLFIQFYRAYLGLTLTTLPGRLLVGLQLIFMLLLGLSLLDGWLHQLQYQDLINQVVNGLLIFSSMALFLITLGYWLKGNRLAGYLFIANSILISATLMRTGYALGWTTDSFWITHAFPVALALDALLLSLALADRTLSIKRERDQAKTALERVDTAYKREQLLAEFIQQAQAAANEHEGPAFRETVDKLLFQCIKRILDTPSAMLLTGCDDEVELRQLGSSTTLLPDLHKLITERKKELLDNCRSKRLLLENFSDPSMSATDYRLLFIPVEMREPLVHCLALWVPPQQPLDDELTYGLRDFVEKALHALVDAEHTEQLQRLARYDDLTGVYNRATMETLAARMLEHCALGRRKLALAFVDLDHFKNLNDSMGHDFGDQCLKLLCHTLQQQLPPIAIIGRFGGDEFLVLLPGCDYAISAQMLQTLNPALARASEKQNYHLSASIGIAECSIGHKMSVAELLKQADRSLYAAKAAGRSQVGPLNTA